MGRTFRWVEHYLLLVRSVLVLGAYLSDLVAVVYWLAILYHLRVPENLEVRCMLITIAARSDESCARTLINIPILQFHFLLL